MPNSTATSRTFTGLALILTLAVGLGFTPGRLSTVDLAAQADASGGLCLNLRGDYGLLASGFRTVPQFLGGGTEQFTATAMWTFHGDGTFTQGPGAALYGHVSGLAPQPPNPLTGTYIVNPDCTGTLALNVPQLPGPIVYAVVIVDNGKEIKGIITSGHSTTSVTLTRK